MISVSLYLNKDVEAASTIGVSQLLLAISVQLLLTTSALTSAVAWVVAGAANAKAAKEARVRSWNCIVKGRVV